MAGGWSNDGAVQDQIDATIEDAVKESARDEAVRGDAAAVPAAENSMCASRPACRPPPSY